jgi:hypothetical protein
MQAQTSVKTSLRKPRSITGKVIDKTVTKPSICQYHCKEGDKFITGGITSEKGNFTSKT